MKRNQRLLEGIAFALSVAEENRAWKITRGGVLCCALFPQTAGDLAKHPDCFGLDF